MSSSLLFNVLHNLLLRESHTPKDAGCQQYIFDLLRPLGFKAVNCDSNGVTNTLFFHTNNAELTARYQENSLGKEASSLSECIHISQLDYPFLGDKVFAFAGHTDVVPTGPLEAWTYPPFSATVTNKDALASFTTSSAHNTGSSTTSKKNPQVFFPTEQTIKSAEALALSPLDDSLVQAIFAQAEPEQLVLHGRGATDMKGGLAAAVATLYNYVKNNPQHQGCIALLVTSDEEGVALNGTKYVVKELQRCKQDFDWCIVGEPSSQNLMGDTIRIGRRGSATFSLTVHGTQGHVAYPHLVDNPVHKLGKLLAELSSLKIDKGNKQFPPSTLQIVDIHAGDGTTNLVPATASLTFNIRFNNYHNFESLKDMVDMMLTRYNLDNCTEVKASCSGEAFVTPSKTPLVSYLLNAIPQHTAFAGNPRCDTGGGTSDGRFIASICPQIVELGTVNATLHKINEHVCFSEVIQLANIYLATATNFLDHLPEEDRVEGRNLMKGLKARLKALHEKEKARLEGKSLPQAQDKE